MVDLRKSPGDKTSQRICVGKTTPDSRLMLVPLFSAKSVGRPHFFVGLVSITCAFAKRYASAGWRCVNLPMERLVGRLAYQQVGLPREIKRFEVSRLGEAV